MMNIGTIAYYVSQNDFFNKNFDIKIDELFYNKMRIVSKFDIFFNYGRTYIYISVFDDNQVLVKFVNDYNNSMKCVYAVNDFDVDRFVEWLKARVNEFAWQTMHVAMER